MEVDYYSKYLKYKAKYIELKNQMGGDNLICCNLCNCIEYDKLVTDICKCTHGRYTHDGCKFKRDKTTTSCKNCNCGKFEVSRIDPEYSTKCKCTHLFKDHNTA